jgi:hypothetical protein
MRVLLLHSEDRLPKLLRRFDLIVDLGRAPADSYATWSKEAGCRVVSLYDFAGGGEDLHRIRELLQLGLGHVVDGSGIDWWDVLSLLIEADLRQLMLIGRLAGELKVGCELSATRPSIQASALQALLGAESIEIVSGIGPARRWVRHYREVFFDLDAGQLSQTLQDKFDRKHRLRRRLFQRRRSSNQPVVLMPSAYINVSRTAVSYAALLPRQEFLLVTARNSGRLKTLPANVSTISLDPYFTSAGSGEIAVQTKAWEALKLRLARPGNEFAAAHATGVLNRIPGLMRWGMAVRDAWKQVLESENVVGCLCADDSNPYTRIPLILARNRGIPTLACHHGALDSRMAVKVAHADVYLAKGEIERDYLVRFCGMAANKVVLGGQGKPEAAFARTRIAGPPESWLVFFSEPYQAAGWRADEVYRDLLPKLWSLAQSCGLKLVFKIHPFESLRSHRRMLRNYLPQEEHKIAVIAGAPTSELWRNTRIALTVQSTVALQCASLEIPVFLCSWLRDSTSGYVEQFAKFGAGQILTSADELIAIPDLLEKKGKTVQMRPALWETMDPQRLGELLSPQNSYFEEIKVQA